MRQKTRYNFRESASYLGSARQCNKSVHQLQLRTQPVTEGRTDGVKNMHGTSSAKGSPPPKSACCSATPSDQDGIKPGHSKTITNVHGLRLPYAKEPEKEELVFSIRVSDGPSLHMQAPCSLEHTVYMALCSDIRVTCQVTVTKWPTWLPYSHCSQLCRERLQRRGKYQWSGEVLL